MFESKAKVFMLARCRSGLILKVEQAQMLFDKLRQKGEVYSEQARLHAQARLHYLVFAPNMHGSVQMDDSTDLVHLGTSEKFALRNGFMQSWIGQGGGWASCSFGGAKRFSFCE